MSFPLPSVEWDDDGYPTEASLATLRTPPGGAQLFEWVGIPAWLRHELACCAAHCCASYREESTIDFVGMPVLRLYFSTGGWSGAEDLMDTMLDLFVVRHFHVQWNRGGHYIFEVPA